ncbi:MAG TPA: glycosyltransferase 87 family protein [Amnibacterium sp.]|nr:glycosyltransferase 87 family protein [Amnibacterium sp.]
MRGSTGTVRRLPGIPVLVGVFVLVHVLLGLVGLVPGLVGPFGDPTPFGDVTGVYRFWIDSWHQQGQLVGIGTPWVYPLLALVPILAASVAGDGAYALLWVLLVSLLDAGALVLLIRRDLRLAWWWVVFTACLGPVAIGRIDAVALPVAIAGVLVLATRPTLAAVLLSIATWIKVWPAALLAAMLVAGRRAAAVITGVAFTTAVVVGIGVALGAGRNVFSFIGTQTGRGLQIEAPVTGLWLIDVVLGVPGASIYYDHDILTFQVTGRGVAATSHAMTAVLAIGVLAVVGLAIVARLRGARDDEVLALTALGLVSAFVALNKVGSPQYLTWYVAPVLLGLATTRRFRVPAVLVLVMAVLTQAVYPWLYVLVIDAVPWMIGVLELRNLLELALLAWTMGALISARGAPREDAVAPLSREADPVGS